MSIKSIFKIYLKSLLFYKLKQKMSQIIEKNKNNEILDIDASNKNEEDLLAFSSKYNATVFKEEDFQENIKKQKCQDRKISGDSTSFSISREYSNLSINSRKINNIKLDEILNNRAEFNESKKQYQERQRKMSSPLCFYFEGFDLVLSKTHSSYIDLNNSLNFVKKESFLGGSSKKVNKLNKSTIINNEFKNNLNFENKDMKGKGNSKENMNNKTERNKRLSFNANSINQDLNYNFISQNINNNLLYFNNYQQQLFKWNYMNLNNLRNNLSNNNRKLSYNIEDSIIGNYFNNILNLNNACKQIQGNYNPFLFSFNEGHEENAKHKNHMNLNKKTIQNSKNQGEKKKFDKRKGDWLCPECHNLNFAFRIVCNRCQLPKPENINTDSIINNGN